MELRILIRALPCYTNGNRAIPIYTLRPQHRNSIYIRSPHYTRCQLWVTYTKYTRQWGLTLLYIPIYSHRPRPVLQLFPYKRNLNYRSGYTNPSHGRGIYRVCTSMGPNKFLRGHCHYQHFLRNSIRGTKSSRVSLRRLRRR
jgi:hypothetical protein